MNFSDRSGPISNWASWVSVKGIMEPPFASSSNPLTIHACIGIFKLGHTKGEKA